MKKKLYFVVLHYQAFDVTCNCISSLLNLITDVVDVSIIVVDNASPNGSGNQLKNKYKNANRVRVVLNKNNDGFAKGNNIGFVIAKGSTAKDAIMACEEAMKVIQIKID